MKQTATLATVWTLLTLAIGLIERVHNGRIHMQQQYAALVQDAKATAQLIGARQWTLPLRENADWQVLEKQFKITILPTTKTVDSQPSEVTRRGNRLITTAAVQVDTTPSAGATTAQPSEFYSAVTISRAISQPTSTGTTTAFIATYVAGLGLLAISGALGYYRVREHTAALSGWAEAVEKHPPSELLQLKKLPSETELASYLNIVAEQTNDALADLYNAKTRSNLVLDNLQDGVLAVDENSQLLLLGGAIDKHLNLSIDAYLYRPLLEIVRVPQVSDLILQVLENASPREGVFDIATSGKCLRLIARPIALGGQRTGAILNTRDETLLKRVEAVRTDFIANASHELKTPLAAIRAYAETLQMGALDDQSAAEEFVNGIVTQADRMGGLIQGMLQLSRIESGTGLRIEPFDTLAAIKSCLSAAGAMAKSKDVSFTFTCDEESLVIHSDLNGFQTIASNLLSNAVRYTPSGGRVTASLSKESDACIFVVEDTGIGIREEDLERIFERFYRAEKDRSSETGGTGLGLSIVKHLTNGLGGSVTARSKPDQGSRFLVCLPLNSSSTR
ncbi:MAG: hypothetical protein Aurels2KO_18540 [Aureliella sp.]